MFGANGSVAPTLPRSELYCLGTGNGRLRHTLFANRDVIRCDGRRVADSRREVCRPLPAAVLASER